MSDEPITVFVCPPPSTCKCRCPEFCEHKWDGPPHEEERFGTATCSRCGMLAIDHDMRVGP